MRIARGLVIGVGFAALLMGAPTGWGQEGATPPQKPEVKTVEVTPTEIKADVGQKIQFSAVAKDASAKEISKKPDFWFASPPDTAGANENGEVVFHQPGEVVVIAVFSNVPGFAHVSVGAPPVASIAIAPVEKAVPVGGSILLSAVARQVNGDPRADVVVEWISLTPRLASVNSSGTVHALSPGQAKVQATAGHAKGLVALRVVPDTIAKLSVDPRVTTARTGDVVHYHASARNGKGAILKALSTSWGVSGMGAAIYPDGGFVAEQPGTYEVTASSGRHTAVASITVTPRNAEREIEVVAHILPKNADGTSVQTAEEWIMGHHLYFSTIADRMFAYDISDPAHPKPLDSMKVDARLINDVSTTPDEKVGVFTREGASNRKNGIVLFDPSDPANLKVFSEYTETVTGGVHSAFINSHYVYITDDATGSLRIIDFQDPKNPKEVARWQTEHEAVTMVVSPLGGLASGRYLHDLYVKDGLAYLAYWRDGLVILDVGSGIKGGSPEHPQLVAQYKYNHYALYGNGWLSGTHSTFRYKNYVFVGDEVFPGVFNIEGKERIPVRGICHVMDVSDIEHPREVAQYEVPEGGIHNFWPDGDVLYVGDYAGGGRALDISGELRGNLYAQGRDIARLWTGDPEGFRPNLPFAWGGQPADGLIYYNDINSGIWIAKLGKPKFKGSTTAPPLRETKP